MKLRMRRSGRHRAPATDDWPAVKAAIDAGAPAMTGLQGRCLGVTYRRQRCTLDAGPDGYCVFHKPGATA